MKNIAKVLKRDRLCLALTGLTPTEFTKLVPDFQKVLEKKIMDNYRKNPKRQRKPGGGKKPFVKTVEEKLFFILLYYRIYPTFDVLGFFYDRDRSNTNRMYQYLTPLLEAALGRKMVLPKRQITSVKEFLEVFPEAKEVFIDGTERPIQRPKNKDQQKANYSGKKKRHTRKNLIVSNRKKRIGIVTQTVEGRKHDFQALKESKLPDHIPKDVRIRIDTGFQGFDKEFPGHVVSMPAKKSKNRPLSNTLKERNKAKSRVRILVEHAIGGVKRYRAVSDVFRNKKSGSDDQAILITSGLWNYHLASS